MSKQIASSIAFAMLASLGCNSGVNVAAPRSFGRPGRLGFVCFNTTSKPAMPAPMDQCAVLDADGNTNEGFALHALVVQSTRGEVGAVDVTNDELLDSNPFIPGYNFVPVGNLPSDIAVPKAPRVGETEMYAYVSNFGSKNIVSVPISKFRETVSRSDAAAATLSLPGSPSAIELSPDETRLVATLPNEGLLIEVVLGTNGTFGEMTTHALSATPSAPRPPLVEADTYERVCTIDSLPMYQAVPARTLYTVGDAPQPVDVIVDSDASDPAVYVADAALPILHRFAFDSSGALVPTEEPIIVDAPLRTLAVGPAVPTTYGGTAMSRYAYAIDIDGKVLALDWQQDTRGTTIIVEPETERPADRLPFEAQATSLDFITPEYDPSAPLGNLCTAANTVGPRYLRGVFVGVTLTDGGLRFVDVYDLDAPCRGTEDECAFDTLSTDANDSIAFIRRHQPRAGTLITARIAATTAPVFTSPDGASWAVDNTGATAPAAVPDFLSMGETCQTPRMRSAFPAEGFEPRICVLADPWAVRAQRWAARWEGDYAAGLLGIVDASGHVEVPAAELCRVGVLSSDAAAATSVDAVEHAAAGDLFVVTSGLLPSKVGVAECDVYVDALEDGTDPSKVTFRITHAADGSLELGEFVGRSDLQQDRRSLEAVRACFGERIVFALRPYQAFTVGGERTGYQHRVVIGADDECVVDETKDPRFVVRLVPGQRFENFQIAFHLSEATDIPEGARLDFSIGNTPPALFVNSGNLPAAVRYSYIDRRVYTIDSAVRGLVKIRLNDVTIDENFE